MSDSEQQKLVNEVAKQEVRWDLKGIEVSDQNGIQEALEEGYEPFAVTPLMKKASPNVVALNPQQQQMTVETVMWLKRAVLVGVQ